MGITKRAISVGVTATMLASLIGAAFAGGAAAATMSVTTELTTQPISSINALPTGTALVSFVPVQQVGPSTTIDVNFGGGLGTIDPTPADWHLQQGTTDVAFTLAPTVSTNGQVIGFVVPAGTTLNPAIAVSIVAQTLNEVDYGTKAGTFDITVTTPLGDTGFATYTVTPGAAALGTVSASPTSVAADGVSTSTITATVTDASANPVAGVTVNFAKTGSAVLSAASAVTNASGVATVTVTDATVESSTITPTATGVTFTPLTVAVSFTAVSASVTCTPSGGPIGNGAPVSCVYTPGNPLTTVSWTSTNFTPTTSSTDSQTFTAANMSSSTVTGTITATGSGGLVATFTYSISPTAVAAPGAPTTAGTITLSNTVSIPQGSKTPVTLGTYTFTEGTAGDWQANDWVQVCFADNAGATNTMTLAGGVVTGPGALDFTAVGAGLSISNGPPCFKVTLGGSSTGVGAYLESFQVSGLTLTGVGPTGLVAAPGTIVGPGSTSYATYTSSMHALTPAGVYTAYFGGVSATASGTLADAYNSSSPGVEPVVVNMTAGSKAFQTPGTLVVGGAKAESAPIVAVSTVVGSLCGTFTLLGNQECLTVDFANSHSVGDPLSESISGLSGTAPSPGSVSEGLALALYPSGAAVPQLRIGVTDQKPDSVSLSEQAGSNGVIAVGTVITLTAPAGVLFTSAPILDPASFECPAVVYAGTTYEAFQLNSNIATLSLDRSSATFTVEYADPAFTVSGASSNCVTSLVFDMQYDVASSSVAGGAINLAVTAGAIPVVPATIENASVGAGIVVNATAPTISIGQNDQALGTVNIVENAAGALSASANTDTFFVCLTSGEYFTRPPWAVVTAGNLLLGLNGVLTGAGVTQSAGVPVNISGPGLIVSAPSYANQACYGWTVYSASTTASTIAIEGVSASGTPTATAHVNVPTTEPVGLGGLVAGTALTPGPTYMAIGTAFSLSSTAGNLINIATVAVRAFSSGITVTALSQPYIAPGTVAGPAGNISFAETGPNLLVANEEIECNLVPNFLQEQLPEQFAWANSNVLPIVSTGATTGLQAHLVNTGSTFFTLMVDQAATNGLGVITVSNIEYNVVSDAPTGNVLIECFNGTADTSGTLDQITATLGADFDQYVSNAIIGTAPVLGKVVLSADSSLSMSGPFSVTTKIVKKGGSITFRVRSNPTLAGDKLGVWIAVKSSSGSWSSYTPHTSVTTDVTGTAYYTYTFTKTEWLAFRFHFGGSAKLAAANSYPSVFGRVV